MAGIVSGPPPSPPSQPPQNPFAVVNTATVVMFYALANAIAQTDPKMASRVIQNARLFLTPEFLDKYPESARFVSDLIETMETANGNNV